MPEQTGAAPQPPLDPDSPFRYVGGDAAVDLVNTVDWTERGLEGDRLTSYDRLLDWSLGAGVVDAMTAERLRRRGASDPFAARAALHDAATLRTTLERLFRAIVDADDTTRALAALNDGMLRRAGGALAVTSTKGSLTLAWPSLADSLILPLVVTAWRAAHLIASDDVHHLRRCGGTDCGWYFVDRSRNGLRHWCEMETCGTREKSRRRAARRARTS